MPECLRELAPGIREAGQVVNSKTTYWVWAAPKRPGQPYTQARWAPYGPLTTGPAKRYLFGWDGIGAGGGLMDADRVTLTSTILSPGLAAIDYENRSPEWVWLMINPLPPGCGAGKKPPPPNMGAEIISHPRILQFTGDYRYTARQGGVSLTRNTDGADVFVAAGGVATVADRFARVLANDAGLADHLGDALSADVPVVDGALRVQVFRDGALIHEIASKVIWISRHEQRR